MACQFFTIDLDQIGLKLEATTGTMETLTSADFDFLPMNGKASVTIETDEETSKGMTGGHGETLSVSGQRYGQVTFSVRGQTATAVDTPPLIGKLFKACGLVERVIATKGVAYDNIADGDCTTATIWAQVKQGGASPSAKIYKFAGCMGNVVAEVTDIGKPLLFSFTFSGKFEAITDTATPIAMGTYSTTTPAVLAGTATASIVGATSCVIGGFSVDVGNEITKVPSQIPANGVSHYFRSTTKPRVTVAPFTVLEATRSAIASITGNTEGATVLPCGSSAIVFSIHAPKSQIITVGDGERSALHTDELTVKCNGLTTATSGYVVGSAISIVQGAVV